MKKLFIVLSLFFVILFISCELACTDNTVTILSYNVCNLFDAVRDGSEYPEYDPATGAWNETLFKKKLLRIAEVIKSSVQGGPDIILLQEIENTRVLQTLVAEGLEGMGYNYLCAPGKTLTATTVGVASKLPVSRVSVYMLSPPSQQAGEALRDILEVTVLCGDRTLIIFNAHWKSKSEGAAVTEPGRLEAAALIAKRVREIRSADKEALIIVAGDLNESSDEYAKTGRQYQTALIETAEKVPDEFGEKSLFLSNAGDEAGVREKSVVFFEPWYTVAESSRGSYVFSGAWETLDHILFMPKKEGLRFKSFQRIVKTAMLDPLSGRPLNWDKKRPDSGYSDHLPVLLTLEK